MHTNSSQVWWASVKSNKAKIEQLDDKASCYSTFDVQMLHSYKAIGTSTLLESHDQNYIELTRIC